MNFILDEMRLRNRFRNRSQCRLGIRQLLPNNIHFLKTNRELDDEILNLVFPGCLSKAPEPITPITDFSIETANRIENRKLYKQEVKRFRDQLKRTDREEKEVMVGQVWERMKFWNNKAFMPDHWYWLRCDYWTQEEATLLACNLSPEGVKLKALIEYKNYDEIPTKAALLTELYDRSVKVNKLQRKVAPVRFMQWCQSKDIELPKEIRAYALLNRILISNVLDEESQTDNGVDEPSPRNAPKNTRTTPWHEVVKGICRELGQVPQTHVMLQQLSCLARAGHPVILEVVWDEKKVHLSGYKKPICFSTIANVLSGIRKEFPG